MPEKVNNMDYSESYNNLTSAELDDEELDDEELSTCCGWPIRQSCCGRCGEGS